MFQPPPFPNALNAWASQFKGEVSDRLKTLMGERVRAITGATGDARDFLQ